MSPLKDKDNKVIKVIEAARDMTDYYNLNKQLKKSLKEKEILLSEVHHRVKNNMQIISSLLKMQAYNITNEEAINCLQDSRNRVKSMSLIHDRIYKSKDFASVEIERYIRDIASYFYRSYSIDPNRVVLRIEAKGIDLNLNTAIPCGLIINELLSNSLKYAFPDQRKGIINITIVDKKKDKYLMSFSDNGIGLPANYESLEAKHLGLKIVNDLTAQLHGELTIKNINGATFEILFESRLK